MAATTPPNPFADVNLDPAVKTIATTIHERLTQWIDARLDQVGNQLETRAQALSTEITGQMQGKFDSMSQDMSQSLQNTLDNIATIKAKFTDPNLATEIDKLAQAVANQKEQVEKRREEFRQYGAVVGQVAKTALVTAVKL